VGVGQFYIRNCWDGGDEEQYPVVPARDTESEAQPCLWHTTNDSTLSEVRDAASTAVCLCDWRASPQSAYIVGHTVKQLQESSVRHTQHETGFHR
jgi:hypothetical protein